jgi:D-aspartate ligase
VRLPAATSSSLPPAVVLGGLENSVSVARALRRQGVAVYAVGGAESPVRYSRACAGFHVLEEGPPQPQYLRWLLEAAPDGTVVFPCDDDAVEVVARHRGELDRLVPIEANDAALLDVLDKDRTYGRARAAGVPTPRTMMVSDDAQLEAAIARIGFPCALKPRHIHEFSRHFRRKVFLADDPGSLRRAFAETSAHGLQMIVTEIVPGPEDAYCSIFTYLDESSQPLVVFTKRKLRQNPPGFGVGCYHITHWDDAVAEMGLRFLQAIHFRGIANVEFKRDSRDGTLKLIECNARFTAANEILQRSGLDFANFVYRRQIGQAVAVPDRVRDDVYMWAPVQDTMSFLASHRRGQLSTRDWMGSLLHRQTLPLFAWRDPLPSLVNLYHMANRRRRRAAVAAEAGQASDTAAAAA